ncbi:CU044_5270 family protein [Streptomyces melanogenes]|uniref:CU044_5270 family protein n=1 Tax=Streptomyces melanogenes TaxID=67326 RepID=UPI0037AE54A1
MNTPDRQELARLLPAPAERNLPPGRHRHHRELLLAAIDSDRPRPHHERPRRRLTRPYIMLPLAAAVAAAVLLTTLPGTGEDGSAPPVEAAAPGTPHRAAGLFDRLATVALTTRTQPVRDDQFVYIRSKATTTAHIMPVKTGPLQEREDWVPQDPRPTDDRGVYRTDGEFVRGVFRTDRKFVPIHGKTTAPGIDRPTYRWLASLPTDPDTLYQRIRKENLPMREGRDFDQFVFDSFGQLLSRNVMPPRTEAALYKAASRIPGVEERPDGVDAIGRHGLVITREDHQLDQRTEWIFDKTTLSFLGRRTYLTKDCEKGKKGTLVWADAILERAVVDRSRQLP